MGHFSKQEIEQQNRDCVPEVSRRERGTLMEDGTIRPVGLEDRSAPDYAINARKAAAARWARTNSPFVRWHEGEGCSVKSCCCDPMEASQ